MASPTSFSAGWCRGRAGRVRPRAQRGALPEVLQCGSTWVEFHVFGNINPPRPCSPPARPDPVAQPLLAALLLLISRQRKPFSDV